MQLKHYMRLVWCAVLVCLLTACEVAATPIAAVASPTSSPAPTSTPVSQLRYGLAPNIASYLSGSDLAAISAVATVETVNTLDNITGYDIVVAYGTVFPDDGWQAAPSVHTISIAINTNLAPLDDTDIRDAVARSFDIPTLLDDLAIQGAQVATQQPLDAPVITRTTLANLGLPDGTILSLAAEPIPAIAILRDDLNARNVRTQLLPSSQNTELSASQAHMTLFRWTDAAERERYITTFGADNVLDLWILPISYITTDPNLPLTFTANGIPIPASE